MQPDAASDGRRRGREADGWRHRAQKAIAEKRWFGKRWSASWMTMRRVRPGSVLLVASRVSMVSTDSRGSRQHPAVPAGLRSLLRQQPAEAVAAVDPAPGADGVRGNSGAGGSRNVSVPRRLLLHETNPPPATATAESPRGGTGQRPGDASIGRSRHWSSRLSPPVPLITGTGDSQVASIPQGRPQFAQRHLAGTKQVGERTPDGVRARGWLPTTAAATLTRSASSTSALSSTRVPIR